VRLDSASDAPPESVRFSDVLAALSFALDLAEGHPAGHSLRTCLIGMELANRLGLPIHDRRDLYYALILKDVGCSSTSARVFELFGGDEHFGTRGIMRLDWGTYVKAMRLNLAYSAQGMSWFQRAMRVVQLSRSGSRLVTELVDTRAHRSAHIVRQLGFNHHVADAVAAVDEHWDGGGQPRGLRAGEIALSARIIALAQFAEVFATVQGPDAALEAVHQRRGKWFDPTIVQAAGGLEHLLAHWTSLDTDSLRREVREREPGDAALLAGPGTLDCIAQGFADVVDAKSPFTAQHSSRVSELAIQIAQRLGFSSEQRAELKRAGLLHDIGKLSVPNSILDKPGPLTPAEWEQVKLHPYYTQRILEHIRGLERLAAVAALHHERLDGRGYFHGLRGEQIPLASQVLATADIYDALTAARPYRPALPEDVAVRIMERDRGTGLLPDCLEALEDVLDVQPDSVRRAA
jgi:HD-GYP domain-containing protein (c-di-GMP phosphodiesterase class II)